jgi:hypothetical protein
MNISAWSVRRPIPVIVLFLVITLAGMVAFGRLGVDTQPQRRFSGGDRGCHPGGCCRRSWKPRSPRGRGRGRRFRQRG